MNLENFPTSPMAKKMLRMVSNGFYDDSYVGKWIYQVMGAQLDIIGGKVEELPEQAFVDEATWGLSFWEQLVGIPIREDLDYDARRFRIKQRLNDAHPVSPAWIKQYLELLTGREVEVTENPKSYTFSIRIESGDGTYHLPQVMKSLDEVKPAHLAYDITIVIREELPLYVGMALKLTENMSQITGVDPPDLGMIYLDKQKWKLFPKLEDIIEIIADGRTGIYIADEDGIYLLADENGAILVE